MVNIKKLKTERLDNKCFAQYEQFKTYLSSIGIDVCKLYEEVGYIWYGNVAIGIKDKDGKIESFEANIAELKENPQSVENGINQIKVQVSDVLVSDDVYQQLDMRSSANTVKGRLGFDEGNQEYFIDDQDQDSVKVSFKLRDIDVVQEYEGSEDKSDENDKLFYNNFQNYLKELIESHSILLLYDRCIEGKRKITISAQYDLR